MSVFRPWLLVACGGALLFAADYPAEQWWLSLVAFIPLMWVVREARSTREALTVGAVWSAAHLLPLAFMLDGFALPWVVRPGVLAYVLGLDIVFAWILFRTRAAPTWWFAAVAGASFAAIEWADAQLPMWGTSKSLARLWVVAPRACGLIAIGGAPLLAFAVVGSQALLVVALQRRSRGALIGAAGVLLLGTSASIAPKPINSRSIKVAALSARTNADAERALTDAAARGARIAVLPEAAFEIAPGERPAFETRWITLARSTHLTIVVAFLEREPPGNRLMVVTAAGKIGEYTKRHLVPGETFPAGDGTRLLFEVDGVRVGAMICQDDNFSDIAHDYAARGAQLLVVPSFEGPPAVAPYHFRNSRLRTIENALTLVRATTQGTSAIIAPGGDVVAAGDGVVADAPVH